jgi:hypothetical protein
MGSARLDFVRGKQGKNSTLETRKIEKRTLRGGKGGVFGEDRGKGGGEEGSVRGGEDEGRTEFDYIVIGAVSAGEDSALAKAIEDIRGMSCGGSARGGICYEVDAEEKS